MGALGWAAIAVLLAGGLDAVAAPRLRRPSGPDAKLETHLRTTVPSAAGLRPLTAHPSKPRVLVRVDSTDAGTVAALRRAGLRIERVLAKHGLVRGRIRKKDLRRLAALDAVRSVQPARRGHVRAGSVTTEGDAAARAPQARATGFDGSGVTVGVISDGIDNVPFSILSGDLPLGTGLPVPANSTCAAGQGDEGTAKLEIVHDVAPGALLRFSEGLSDKLAFVDAIDCLRDAGAQVIVDDVGFLDEPYFEDGVVAEAVREVVEAGVSFHSAAGNSAEAHYSAEFDGVTTEEGVYHAFDAGDDLFNRTDVPPGGRLACALQWNDRFGAADDDYDLELWHLDGTPSLVDFSANVQDGTQDPFEGVGIENTTGATIRVGLRIRRESGDDRLLKLVCIGGGSLQHRTAAGSIFGHPSLPEVVSVGAIDVADFGLNEVELFSSQGPVEIFFPAREVREKPDLVAFDGVTTSICPSPENCFDPFFGTSAAAPHAAGVAALLLSKNACLSPAEVQARLVAAADDILTLGFDDVSGAGRLDAFDTLTAADACDDGNACTRDTCTPATGCQHAPLGDGLACPDGNLCNGDETCQAGACTAGIPPVCNDFSLCTTDSCSPSTGCVFISRCDDANPCSTDTCDPLVGCGHAPKADGTPCPDDDLCDGTEACQAGNCATPPAPLVCDDGGACTSASCDADDGCQYLPRTGFDGIACLCDAGLAFAGCPASPTTLARFARACEIAASATGQRPKRARRLLSSAARKLEKASRQTWRSITRKKLAPECGSTLGATLDDLVGRTLLLSGSL